MLEKYPDILKVPEISQILRIGIQKVYKLLKSGEIKNKKIGNLYFISKEDLIKYIRGNKTKNSSSLSSLANLYNFSRFSPIFASNFMFQSISISLNFILSS